MKVVNHDSRVLEPFSWLLLVVRTPASLPGALAAMRALVRARRRASPQSPPASLAGVWVSRDLDGELPTAPGNDPGAASAPLWLRETVSINGLWSLHWLSGPAVDDVPCSDDGQRTVRARLARHLRRGRWLPGPAPHLADVVPVDTRSAWRPVAGGDHPDVPSGNRHAPHPIAVASGRAFDCEVW